MRSQGQTLDAAIVDLEQGEGVSLIASYVAMTRVKRREDILIYRPFRWEIFNGGPLRGPTLLLQHLRGDHINWKAVENSLMPTLPCSGCGVRKPKRDFDPAACGRKTQAWCKACIVERA